MLLLCPNLIEKLLLQAIEGHREIDHRDLCKAPPPLWARAHRPAAGRPRAPKGLRSAP